MSKGGKMFDAIMITIIIIASLNYADYIKVDTKLMIVLLAIALYVTAKNMQKTQTSKKVEPLDGSTVAFDKEAFVNLNNIVNELVKKDSVTIPGNLIVLGKTTFKDDVSINDGKGMLFLNKAYARFGEGAANRRDQYDGEIAYGRHGEALCIVGAGKERNIFTWGHLTSKEGGTLSCTYLKCTNISATSWIAVGTDDANAIRIRQNRIGTKACADIYFNPNGWLYHYTYGTGNYRADVGFAASNLYAKTHIDAIGSLTVTGAFNCDGVSSFKMPNGHYSHINASDGICYIRGDVKLDGHDGSGSGVHAGAYVHHANSGQGLFFNQGDRQIRLASGTANAMLDFDGSKWLLSYAANQYYQFSNTNLDWVRAGHNVHGVRWSY